MNVNEVITARILDEIAKGTLPWNKPWKSAAGEGPTNAISGKAYQGLNVFLLNCAPYARPYFLTYKQAAAAGGTVRKGEKGSPVIFWKTGEYVKTGESETTKSFLLRYYTVFNVAQCDGLPADLLPMLPVQDGGTHGEVVDAEAIVSGYQAAPTIQHGGGGAYYRPSHDVVQMPAKADFESLPHYYSTLFHELTHSTGHSSRLKRAGVTDLVHFGSTNYSKEELIAEMGAAFLCGHANISNAAVIASSASYLVGWSQRLKADPSLLVQAASAATKAVHHIMGTGKVVA